MYSGKGVVWHYMGRYVLSFFPSYEHYIQPCWVPNVKAPQIYDLTTFSVIWYVGIELGLSV